MRGVTAELELELEEAPESRRSPPPAGGDAERDALPSPDPAWGELCIVRRGGGKRRTMM